MTGIIAFANAYIQQASQQDLERYWCFKWSSSASLEFNLYQFHKMLDLYGNFCRRWEEVQNGRSCVVERVRDTYLRPSAATPGCVRLYRSKEMFGLTTRKTLEGQATSRRAACELGANHGSASGWCTRVLVRQMRRTRWFGAVKHKPARIGIYEFYDSLRGRTVMAHWDGDYWTWDGGWRWNTYGGDKWRGLLKPNIGS